MEIDKDSLARVYRDKSDEELLHLHHVGRWTLTADAYEVLEAELAIRGIPIPKRTQVNLDSKPLNLDSKPLNLDSKPLNLDSKPLPQWLRDYWQGRARLASAYWILGVLGGWVVCLLSLVSVGIPVLVGVEVLGSHVGEEVEVLGPGVLVGDEVTDERGRAEEQGRRLATLSGLGFFPQTVHVLVAALVPGVVMGEVTFGLIRRSLSTVMVLLVLAYFFFVAVSVWRCAWNTRSPHGKGIGYLARFIVVATGLNLLQSLPPVNRNSEKVLNSTLYYLAEIFSGKGYYTGAKSLYQNVAISYLVKLDWTRAELLLQRVLAISEKELDADDPWVAVWALSMLGKLYLEKGDYTRAELLLQRALAISEKGRDPNDLWIAVSILTGLGELYLEKGDYTRAEPLLQRALAISEKAPLNTELFLASNRVARILTNLAALYQAEGDDTRAEPLLQRALAISEKWPGSHVVNVLWNLQGLVWAQGDTDQALSLLGRANKIREYNLALMLATGSEDQKQAYMATLTGETSITVAFHLGSASHNRQAARLALTTILQRKGRVLEAMTEAMAALRQHMDPNDQALLDQLMKVRTQLATLLLRRPGQAVPDQAQVDKLQEEAQALEARISAHSVEFRAQSQPVTLERVQQAIPEGAALVELVVYFPFNPKAPRAEQWGAERYAAYVLHPEGEPGWVDLGEAALIDENIALFQTAIEKKMKALQLGASDLGSNEEMQQVARTLEEQLMRPLRPLLGSARQVLLSPDGALNLLPFGALVDAGNHYLIERYSFSYLSSGRDLLRLQASFPAHSGDVIIANPDFGTAGKVPLQTAQAEGGSINRRSRDFSVRGYGSLPSTAKEAQALKALLPNSRLLTGQQATEAALKQIKAPRLLHIATHGFFLRDEQQPPAAPREEERQSAGPRPEHPLLRSFLVLAGANQLASGGDEDGVLTALEASGLDLWGTKLVVLSACDTGLGTVQNGEGVYGLRRALVLAGAESQLMTLWKSSDELTSYLMKHFYKHLRAGMGRAEALREVQRNLLKYEELNHPYFWASFILSGAWKPLAEQEAK